jgi:hypothetical protein
VIRLAGVGAAWLRRPTDAAPFDAYFEQAQAPSLRPGDIVVLDNPALIEATRPSG